MASQAGSEGELCPQADSIGSSGSTSTLASSVIEVESSRDDLALCHDEEDISPLPPPPTISITEEIMQFINQSRVREGMAELTSEVCQSTPESVDVQSLEEQQLDESWSLGSGVDENEKQTKYTKQSKAQKSMVDFVLEKDNDSHPSCEASDSPPEDLERPPSPLHTSNEVNQFGELSYTALSQIDSSETKLVNAISEKEGKDTEDTFTEREESHLEDNLDKSSDGTSCVAESASAQILTTAEATDSSLVPKVEVEQKLTKSDWQIIEKIRSYYEAAEAGVEEGQTARRNSFSNIPAGLVKDSVSRYNVCVHQKSLVDSESHSDCVEYDSSSLSLPMSDQAKQILTHVESADTASPLSHSDLSQEHEEILESKSVVVKDEQICEFNPCIKLWKEKEGMVQETQINLKAPLLMENSSGEPTDASEKKETSINCMMTQVQDKQSDLSQCGKNISNPLNRQTKEKADMSLQHLSRTKARMSTNGGLDSLPSQIKVGRWSRHNKVVTCSHTLYEGMAEVPDLGFYEGGPVSQCLVENSEKILNKVQMLARMYTAKASSMKVPLHQKRTRGSKGAWAVEAKVSIPPKYQLQLHQGDMRTLSQPTDLIESSISKPSEPFGHTIVREQFSTTYHQENDCNLIGPPENISPIGSNWSFSSAESSAASVQILSERKTVMESQVFVISNNKESSLEKCQSFPHEAVSQENQSLLLTTCSGIQAQTETEMSSNHCRFPLDQHSDNVIQENHCIAMDKSISINGIEEESQREILQEENPTFVSPTGSAIEILTDPVVISHSEEEAHNVEKDNLIVKPCESMTLMHKSSKNDKPDKTEHAGYFTSQQAWIDDETTGSEELTSTVSSAIDVEAWSPLQSAPTSDNCVPTPMRSGITTMSISERSEQSCPLLMDLLQEDTTNPTQLAPLLDSCGNCSHLVVKTTEDISNDLKLSSPSSTSPLGAPPLNELPKFTSQRPSNILTTTGKRSPFNWNSSSLASSPQRLPHTSLQIEVQILDTSVSDLSPHRQHFSQSLNDKPPTCCEHSLDAKPPSAFSPNLRIRSPSPNRGAPIPRPISTASALTKSLAASCISQTISQSMAKRSAHLHSASQPVGSPPPPRSSITIRSPSPKSIDLDTSVEPSFGSTSNTGLGSQPTRFSPSPFRSSNLRSSPATIQSPPPYRSQRSVSPAPPVSLHSTSKTPSSIALEQHPYTILNGNNNNNNFLSNNGWATNYQKTPHSNVGGYPNLYETQRTTSHNRVAWHFPSSEPSSRVQSPSPSICPSPVTQICSPSPAQNHTSNLVMKPPNPRTPRQGRAGSITPLSLELSRSTSACSLSPCGSPRITSPPPIGIPSSVWGFANPQPRNPSLTNVSSPTKAEASFTQRGTRIISPIPTGMFSCSTTISQSQRRQRGSSLPFVTLGDRPPSPAVYEQRSWAENGRWSLGSESGLTSPRGGSCGSPSSISPGPLSPVKLAPGRTSHRGKHFTSIAWPDVHDLLTKYNTEPNTQTDTFSCAKAEQDDMQLAETTCRSTLICPYVAQSDCGYETETPIQVPKEDNRADNVPNQGSKATLKTSYATTVNLQIAGSGRITSFSNAQVSLSQTLAPVTDNQNRRSINSCNFSLQNCRRL
ncbi:uncharacterized protein plekhg2 isoform X2 [Xyrauchen texanus]|uniref:uncharacterized protein plekhg2 isoform X2 n=1 Tax=Xyrauchen texanus TaxID=154827 RepID=UPI00224258E4|nr:uncharacterized protein plekhg2 isoform X2 [Xyrauchen texanus]